MPEEAPVTSARRAAALTAASSRWLGPARSTAPRGPRTSHHAPSRHLARILARDARSLAAQSRPIAAVDRTRACILIGRDVGQRFEVGLDRPSRVACNEL